MIIFVFLACVFISLQSPLPERIPRPTEKQQKKLLEYGVTFDLVDEDEKNYLYWKVVLPDSLELHDDSWRSDLPHWYILKKNTNIAYASIYGAWKGLYDNELEMRVYDKEETVELRNEKPEKVESAAENMLSNAVKSGDVSFLRLALRAIGLEEQSAVQKKDDI